MAVNPLRPIAIYGPPGGQVRLESGDGHFVAYDDVDAGRYPFPLMPKAFTALNCFVEKRGQRDVGMDGFEWYGHRFPAPGDPDATPATTCPADPQNDWFLLPTDVSRNPTWWQMPPLVATARFAPEVGFLHVVGRTMRTVYGEPWRVRGLSLFLLPMRFFAGEDVAPDFAWMRQRGYNEARVFVSVNWGEELAPGWLAPWTRPDFVGKWHRFLELAATYGVRIKITVHTYAFDLAEMRSVLQQIYDVASTHWNARVQGANEAENNGIDVLAIYQGVDRRGVLSNYGNDPERHCDGQPDADAWGACMRREVPNLETGASHDLRRDMHSSRNPKDGFEFQNLFGIPWEWEEPLGVIDLGDPIMIDDGGGFWHHDPRGGIRTTNPDVIIAGAIVAAFYTTGYTLHLECGVRAGRTPRPTEPIQDGIAELLGRVYQFLPVDLSLGAYTRPGLAGFGIAWTDGDSDSLVGHAYGVITGDVQHVVVPMPSPTWRGFQPVDGWRLDAIGPVPYLARLVRA